MRWPTRPLTGGATPDDRHPDCRRHFAGGVHPVDADAALTLLRAELQPGDVVLVKASNSAGLGALADSLAADGRGDTR